MNPQTVAPGNLVSLGRQLRRFLYTPPIFALLDPWQCGWLDGGCRILGEAVVLWLGPEAALTAVLGASGQTAHVLVRYRGWLIDGDGLTRADTLIRRWLQVEHVAGAHLGSFERAPASPEIPSDREVSRRLAEQLESRFPVSLVRSLL